MPHPATSLTLTMLALHAFGSAALAQSDNATPESSASQNTHERQASMSDSAGDRRNAWDDDDDDEGGFGIDEIDIGLRWIAPASIDGGSGDVSMTRAGAALGFEYELENEIELSFGGEYYREDWNYSGQGSGLLPGVNKPWDGFQRYGFEVGASVPVAEWEIFGEIGLEWAEEIGGSTSDSMLIEGLAAGRRQIWDNFDIVVGFFYGESLEGDDDILPLIGFDWRISDKDMLSLNRPREGYQLTYRRQLDNEWMFNAYGRFVNEEFRLDKNGPTGGGSISSDEFQIGAGVEYQVGPGRAGLDLGYSFGREYEVLDNNGDTFAKPEVGGAFTFGVYYTIGF